MKQKIAICAICFTLIFLFLTPTRWSETDYTIRHESIFSSGFIDFPRLILYLTVAFAAIFFLDRGDFSFLNRNPVQIFLKRTLARTMDILIVVLFTIAVVIATYEYNPDIILTFLCPGILFLTWMLYFVFLFRRRRTIGNRIVNLTYKQNAVGISTKGRWIIKELIMILPFLISAFYLGAINHNSREGIAEYDEESWGLFIWFTFLLVYIVSSAGILFTSKRQSIVDKLSGIIISEEPDPAINHPALQQSPD